VARQGEERIGGKEGKREMDVPSNTGSKSTPLITWSEKID